MSDTEHEQDIPLEEPEPTPEPDETEQEEAAEEEESPSEQPDGDEPASVQDEDRSKLAKALDTRFANYRKSVEEKLGDELPDWLLCPLCASGMAPGYVNRHDLGRVPEDVSANVQMFLGFARETEYPNAPGVTTCDVCSGLGKVSTGSRVSEHMTITCPNCKGYGYMPPPGVAAVGNGTAHTAEESVTQALADLDTPDRDNWGEPRVLPDGTLNGNFGKMPQFKSVHPVYGVTANLSPEELALG